MSVVIVVPAEFDISKLVFKSTRQNNGVPEISARYDGGFLSINLAPTQTEWLRAPFGIDACGKFAKKTDTVWLAPFSLDLTPELVDIFQAIDAKAKEFVDSLGLQISFSLAVQTHADYEPRLSAKVSLDGETATTLHILNGKNVQTKQGKEIAPLLDENREFRGGQVCGVVTLRPWVHTDAGVTKAGCMWMVEEAIIKAAPKRKWASIFDPAVAAALAE